MILSLLTVQNCFAKSRNVLWIGPIIGWFGSFWNYEFPCTRCCRSGSFLKRFISISIIRTTPCLFGESNGIPLLEQSLQKYIKYGASIPNKLYQCYKKRNSR